MVILEDKCTYNIHATFFQCRFCKVRYHFNSFMYSPLANYNLHALKVKNAKSKYQHLLMYLLTYLLICYSRSGSASKVFDGFPKILQF